MGLAGYGAMALAVAAWAVEKHTCRDWLKLHACWHLGVGVGTYCVSPHLASRRPTHTLGRTWHAPVSLWCLPMAWLLQPVVHAS